MHNHYHTPLLFPSSNSPSFSLLLLLLPSSLPPPPFPLPHQVLNGMKQLKAITIDGNPLRVTRYRPIIPDGSHPIDDIGEEEAFDEYSMHAVMKDFMHADPATRYQIAKNHFERALVDAKVRFGFTGYVRMISPRPKLWLFECATSLLRLSIFKFF